MNFWIVVWIRDVLSLLLILGVFYLWAFLYYQSWRRMQEVRFSRRLLFANLNAEELSAKLSELIDRLELLADFDLSHAGTYQSLQEFLHPDVRVQHIKALCRNTKKHLIGIREIRQEIQNPWRTLLFWNQGNERNRLIAVLLIDLLLILIWIALPEIIAIDWSSFFWVYQSLFLSSQLFFFWKFLITMRKGAAVDAELDQCAAEFNQTLAEVFPERVAETPLDDRLRPN